MTSEIKIIAGLVVVSLMLIGVLAWRHALIARGVTTGQTVIKTEDAAASATALAEAQAQTESLRVIAANAVKESRSEHQQLIDYIAAHPLPAVRVCIAAAPNNRHPGLPDASAPVGGAANTGTGRALVGSVPDGSLTATADVTPELNLIVRSAGEVAISLRECQSRSAVELK